MAAKLRAQEFLVNQTERREHIPEVQSGGLDSPANFFRLQRRRRHLQVSDRAVLADPQHPARLFGQVYPIRPLAGPDKAGYAASAAAVYDLVFRIGIEQFIGEVYRRCRRLGIQIDHLRLHVGCFPGQYLSETP